MKRGLLAALSTVLLTACTGGPAPDAGGDEIYGLLCARCHGAELQGGVGPGLGVGSPSAGRPDEYLLTVITRGQGGMPAFGNTLSEDQILRLVAFIRERQADGS
jgi:mono/diheme cytochrome c family protein